MGCRAATERTPCVRARRCGSSPTAISVTATCGHRSTGSTLPRSLTRTGCIQIWCCASRVADRLRRLTARPAPRWQQRHQPRPRQPPSRRPQSRLLTPLRRTMVRRPSRHRREPSVIRCRIRSPVPRCSTTPRREPRCFQAGGRPHSRVPGRPPCTRVSTTRLRTSIEMADRRTPVWCWARASSRTSSTRTVAHPTRCWKTFTSRCRQASSRQPGSACTQGLTAAPGAAACPW